MGCALRGDPRDVPDVAARHRLVGRIASIVAPLVVPPLLVAGGAPVLFVVFAVFFAVAAAAAWGLVDRRGVALDDR